MSNSNPLAAALPPGMLREDLAIQVAEGKITYSEMVELANQDPPVQQLAAQTQTAATPKTPNAKVALCFASTYHLDAVWAFNILPVFRAAPPNTELLVNWKYGLAESREYLVNTVLENHKDVTHIMFIDTDTIPLDINCVNTLLAVKVPFVGAMYWNSMNAGVNAWVGGNVIQQEQPADVVKVDQIGIGCCLIDVKVFQQLKDAGVKRPWFKFHIGEKPGEYMGEDMHFQLLLKKIGIQPYIHTKCVCNHYKPMEFDINGVAVYRQPGHDIGG